MFSKNFTNESVIKAGLSLEGAGRAVTGLTLSAALGGGIPISVKKIWDEHKIRTGATAGANAPVVLANVGGRLKVLSPFCEAFPKAARALGGDWDGSTWNFAMQEHAEVTALCQKIYGEAGEPDVQRVNLVFTVVEPWRDSSPDTGSPSLYLAGRLVAKHVKKQGIFFGDAVVIKDNLFEIQIGKFSEISAKIGTKFIMRDLPISVLGKTFERAFKRFKVEIEPASAESPVMESYTIAVEIISLKDEVQVLQTQLAAAKRVCNNMQRKLKEGKLTDEICDSKLHELSLVLRVGKDIPSDSIPHNIQSS
jgi:hypothetical protein